MTTTTIDITPTWTETAHMLLMLIERGDPAGQAYARSEILRMAAALDQIKADQEETQIMGLDELAEYSKNP